MGTRAAEGVWRSEAVPSTLTHVVKSIAGIVMRAWFLILREVEVGQLVEISILVKKAPDR
jgi:hypothetical protein